MVTEKSTYRVPQLCDHPTFGLLMRRGGTRFFKQVGDTKTTRGRKHHTVDHTDVPSHLIRTIDDSDHDTIVQCSGCGGMFPKSEMDATLCRGFDGCSANSECSKLNANMVLPVGGIQRGLVRLH